MFLKSCCCGFSLRRSSIAIVLSAILFQLLLLIDAAIELGGNAFSIFKMIHLIRDEYIDELLETHLFSIYVTGTALYGIIKENPKKMAKYLMLQVGYLVTITGTIVWLIIDPLVMLSFLGLDETFQIPFMCVLVSLFGLLLYFLMVVHSYYRELNYLHPREVLSKADIPLRVV